MLFAGQPSHLGAQREGALAGQLPQVQDEVLRLPLRAVHLRGGHVPMGGSASQDQGWGVRVGAKVGVINTMFFQSRSTCFTPFPHIHYLQPPSGTKPVRQSRLACLRKCRAETARYGRTSARHVMLAQADALLQGAGQSLVHGPEQATVRIGGR